MTSYQQGITLSEYLYIFHQHLQGAATMTSYPQGVSLPEVSETPETLEWLTRDVFDDLPHSMVHLREQVTALEARNTDLEKYAHMVAHDLKVPLTVLIMTADTIKEIPDLTGEESRECILQIKSIAYQMNSLIDNLLLFAEVSKAEAPVGSVHMDRVVANVQHRLSYMIKEQQAQIILPEVWPDAIGYEPWIEEVWANYLSNALKYGRRPLRVELGASSARSAGMLRFWIRDNGPGIPPEVCRRLFIPYNQISRLSTNSGHGLGLSIVGSIVEKLGGQVGIESEVGQGSLFFFTLPAAPNR
jgi:two-component system sensor histidine kinase/response regulator